MAGYGSRPRPLYGMWIDEALNSGDTNQMKEVLQAARGYFNDGGLHTLYGVIIRQRIASGASTAELQSLLETARATGREDLQGAIAELEKHLGSTQTS